MQENDLFFETLCDKAVCYLEKLGIPCSLTKAEEGAAVLLESISSFIQLSGAVEGGFLFSADRRLASELAKAYMIDTISDEEAAGYAVEVVAEVSNVISGNALTVREDRDILLGNPLMIVAKRAEVKAYEEVRTAVFRTPYGMCHCLFVPVTQKAQLASIFTIEMD